MFAKGGSALWALGEMAFNGVALVWFEFLTDVQIE